ncbi:hypothetical protein Ahy_B09g095212 [Arachis hypogaea]|uniref:Uncharacterized protein n=1 Tax=Arachis hypogaea TaxID=3818 RepID=A0A444XE04_ARAHY|nr:hypothetical protein Ahy_B09g095212 [Arachis hypogaea]
MEGLASWCTCTMKVLFFSGEAAASVAVTVRIKERRVWQGAIGAAVETEWEVMEMGLKLILLLIKLHLVLSTQQLHEYEVTNPHHSRASNQFSIAIPPLKSTSGVSESTAHAPSKSSIKPQIK